MYSAKKKLKSFREIRDKSGSSFYEFSTSWWALLFFISIVGGCVLWNTFISPALKFDPYPYNGLRTALALLGAIQTPVLLLYSRKSTDYRKSLLEQDYELEKKIFRKIEVIESEIKKDREVYLKEMKKVVLIAKRSGIKKKRIQPSENKILENKELVMPDIHNREHLQNQKLERSENSESMTA